jgi:hypothetical protein
MWKKQPQCVLVILSGKKTQLPDPFFPDYSHIQNGYNTLAKQIVNETLITEGSIYHSNTFPTNKTFFFLVAWPNLLDNDIRQRAAATQQEANCS